MTMAADEKYTVQWLQKYAQEKLRPHDYIKFNELLERSLIQEDDLMADMLMDRMGEIFPEMFDMYREMYEDAAHGGLRPKRSVVLVEWLNRS